MNKELKEARKMMYLKKPENTNKERKIIKRSKIGILELKCTVTETKNSPQALTADLRRQKKESEILFTFHEDMTN